MKTLKQSQRQFDLLCFFLVILAFTVLYYPVWITEYVYTDEVVQIWYYGNDPGYQMFLPQGRYVTEKLMNWLFGSVQHIEQIKWIRAFSFSGWLLCIPIWYYVIKSVLVKEGLPVVLAFFSTLYLVCIP